MKLYILDRENNPLGPYDADLVRTWIARDEISPALPARLANDDGTANDDSPTSTVGELLDAANTANTTDNLDTTDSTTDTDSVNTTADTATTDNRDVVAADAATDTATDTDSRLSNLRDDESTAATTQPVAQTAESAPPAPPPTSPAPQPTTPQPESAWPQWPSFVPDSPPSPAPQPATPQPESDWPQWSKFVPNAPSSSSTAPTASATTAAPAAPAASAAPTPPVQRTPQRPPQQQPQQPPPPLQYAPPPTPLQYASPAHAQPPPANIVPLRRTSSKGLWIGFAFSTLILGLAAAATAYLVKTKLDEANADAANAQNTAVADPTSPSSRTPADTPATPPANADTTLPTDGAPSSQTTPAPDDTPDIGAPPPAPLDETPADTGTSSKKTTDTPPGTSSLLGTQQNENDLAAVQKIRTKIGTKEPFLLRQIDIAIEKINLGEPFYADRVVFVEKNDPLLALKKEFWLLKVSHDEAVRKTLANIMDDTQVKTKKYVDETIKRNPETYRKDLTGQLRYQLGEEAKTKFNPLAETKAQSELARLRTVWSSRIEELRLRTEATTKKTGTKDDYFFAQLADALKNTCTAKLVNLSPDFTPFNADDVSLEKPTGFLATCFEERKAFYKLKIARDLAIAQKTEGGVMPTVEDPTELEIKKSGRINPPRLPNFRTENKVLVDANPVREFYITEQEMKEADERLTPLIAKVLAAVKSGNLSAVTSNFERLGRMGYEHKGILFSLFFTYAGKESLFAYIYRHLGKDADAVARKTLDAFLATRRDVFVGDTAVDGIQHRMRALLDTMKANSAKGISSEPEAKLLEGHFLMLLRSRGANLAKADSNPDGKFNDHNQLFSQTYLGNCSMISFYRGAMFKPQFKDQLDKRRTVTGNKVVWNLGDTPYAITNKDLSYLSGFGAGDTDARSLITALNYEYLDKSTFHYGHGTSPGHGFTSGRNDKADGASLLFPNHARIEMRPLDNEQTRLALRAASEENVVLCAGTAPTDYWIKQYGAIPLSLGIGYTDIDDLRRKIDQWTDAFVVPAPGVVKAPNTENGEFIQTLPPSFLTKHHSYQLTAIHGYTVMGMKGDTVLFINTGGNVLHYLRFADFIKYFDQIYGIRLPEDPKYARTVVEGKKSMAATAIKETHYNAARVRTELKRLVGVKDQLRLTAFNTILSNNGFFATDGPGDPRSIPPFAVGFYPPDSRHPVTAATPTGAAPTTTARRSTTPAGNNSTAQRNAAAQQNNFQNTRNDVITPRQERAAEAAVRRYAESIEPVNVELAGLARNAKELKDATLEKEVDGALKKFLIPQEMMFLLTNNDRQNGLTWSIAENAGNDENSGTVGTYGSNRVWSITLRPNGVGECSLTAEPSALQRKVFRKKFESKQSAQQKTAATAQQNPQQNPQANAQQNPRQGNRRNSAREDARGEQIEDASKFTRYVSPFSWKLRGPRTLVIEWGGGVPPDPVMGKESAWTLREVEAEWQFKYGPLLLIGEKETPYTLEAAVRRGPTTRQKR